MIGGKCSPFRAKAARISRHLPGAYLREADLQGAKLRRATLFLINLEGANLQGAQITAEQLAQAGSLQGAILPDGTRHL